MSHDEPFFSPFQAALDQAAGLSNFLAKSTLLAELARAQVDAGLYDQALECIQRIPNRAERRAVLLDLALNAIQSGKTDPLLAIVQNIVQDDPKAMSTVGRLALSLAEAVGPTPLIMDLIRIVDAPFDSEKNRYEFFDNFLTSGSEDRLPDAKNLLKTFQNDDYRDWARLALAKRLAELGHQEEAQVVAESFTLPKRRSWALLELGRLKLEKPESNWKEQCFFQAADILLAVPVDADNAEPFSIQLRITGTELLTAGLLEKGSQLLERCETAAVAIIDPVRKYRAKLFLAKILRQHGLISTIKNYIDTEGIVSTKCDPTDKSRLHQWIAEANGPPNDIPAWTDSIQSVGESNLPKTDEFQIASRIAEVVRRFAFRQAPSEPTGDPKRDALLLSTEEFEAYYFSPFALDDCGC